MKLTLGKIRRLVREALTQDGKTMFGTQDELDRSISAMDPDTVSEFDYVDVDTGEIYLEIGEQARVSILHPQYEKDRQTALATKQAKWAAEEAELDREDAEYERRGQEQDAREGLQFTDAIIDFARGMKDYELAGQNIEGVASDAAENFFHVFPQWKIHAAREGMSRADVKDLVASYIYDAMSGHLK